MRPIEDIAEELAAARARVRELEGEMRAALKATAKYSSGTVCEGQVPEKGKYVWRTVKVLGMGENGLGYWIVRQKKDGGWYANYQWISANWLRPIEK